MKYQISSDNMQVSDSMHELIMQKMEKFERAWEDLPEDSSSARIVVNKASGDDKQFIVKIDVVVDGEQFYTEEPGYTFEEALVATIDEFQRTYTKHKEMLQNDWDELRESKRLSEEDLLEEIENSSE